MTVDYEADFRLDRAAREDAHAARSVAVLLTIKRRKSVLGRWSEGQIRSISFRTEDIGTTIGSPDRGRSPFAHTPSDAFRSGSERMRLPVTSKIALATAGAIGGVPGSPMPPHLPPPDSAKCVSMTGASAIRAIW